MATTLEEALRKVETALAPSTFRDELRATAAALVHEGKGLLACDEPPHVLPGRMKMCWEKEEDCTEAWRIGYRSMLFTAPGLSDYISGVILHEETVGQEMKAAGGNSMKCPELLKSLGIIPGIKVDRAFAPMMGCNGETHTMGLDGLGERCQAFYAAGCRFAKWRAPIHIGAGMPSEMALSQECWSLARYASVCQQHGLMPIVEPDVVMDGDHDVDISAAVTLKVLQRTFSALVEAHVDLEGILIKTNMVRPGEKSGSSLATDAGLTGAATVKVFAAALPSALPGVVFLSGGMSEAFATDALAAINAHPDRRRIPSVLTFSYGRALQHCARVAWKGKPENVEAAQQALVQCAKANSDASRGTIDSAKRRKLNGDASHASLHVAGGNKY